MANPSIPIIANPPRVTMFLQGPTKVTTETHWYVGNNQLAAALAEAKNLTLLRQAVLGNDVKIILVRCSLDNVDRDSFVDDTASLLKPTAFGPCDPGDRNILVRLEGTTIYRKSLYLNMVPDAVVSLSKYDPNAVVGFNLALIRYLSYLAPSSSKGTPLWGFLVRNKDPLTAPLVNVLNVSVDVTGTSATFTTDAPVILSVGNVVQVSRCADINGPHPEFNGQWVIDTVAGNQFSVTGTWTPNVGFAFVNGKANRLERVFQIYTNYALRGIGGHKRGNRALTPLGRVKRPRTQVTH